ncbi:hypothetical protein VOLCADRAFT_107592 [Volvox carteri f. nagariensis]|uniref:JmjC domain-containing protein n=1 Tax=Volvox carteri f. nagariensis TaxID=3068 RepID=D8UEW3_VOLCA|nr:uncharacterized protein VOLCADRAFT_107592 [Volvox carteri f. nagariensis]EFJ41711.1 hypothetical protein VOLCADRAFT_107592 [Volvox carteri f. nagariensis]|eukprot:XP_002957213.1 hypothetical protein VOLCADRAFT_107592 [Volvox carteri f. nagariensis]
MLSVDATPPAAAVAAPIVPASQILRLLQQASREVRDLDLGRSVDRVDLLDLTPLRFATEYVQRNKPVVITGAISCWPAMTLWGERYLESHPAGETVVTVDVTPNGRGDAITTVTDPATGELRRWFVTPHQRRMTLRQFFHLMRHQNSNLSEELGLLLGDIGPGIPWAEEVFGGPPEATNIWIGDGRSATSFHKDHYDNLYAVIRGTKLFTLLPPCDVYRMYLTRCPAAVYMPRCDVPPGGMYGEVSPQPGGMYGGGGSSSHILRDAATVPAASTPAVSTPVRSAANDNSALGGVTAVPGRLEGGRGAVSVSEQPAADPTRLVAVLQDPGDEVLWSAVDTTVQGAGGDPVTRRTQLLFFGPLEDGGGAARSPAGSSGDSSDNDSDSDSSLSDPWATAGGPPLIVEVGPGEVLYLPSLWYHQRTTRRLLAVDVVVAVVRLLTDKIRWATLADISKTGLSCAAVLSCRSVQDWELIATSCIDMQDKLPKHQHQVPRVQLTFLERQTPGN